MDGSEKRLNIVRMKTSTITSRQSNAPSHSQQQTIVMYTPEMQEEEPEEVTYSGNQIITMGEDGQQYIITEDMLEQAGMISDGNVLYVANDGNAVAMTDMIEEDQQDYEEVSEEVVEQETEYMECEVTEEVITDDWVQQSQDGECVEVTVAQITDHTVDEDDVQVPLPTDQDEYTTSRPYPCDFCSRRFRKKANLMNHMVAHQNDRPHVCNLCGARYIRKCDLLNHLKIHAYIPDEHELNDTPLEEYPDNLTTPDYELEMLMGGYGARPVPTIRKRKPTVSARGGRKRAVESPLPYRKQQKKSMDYQDEDTRILSQVAEQHESYGQQRMDKYPVTDPRKPFVCQQCGVGFAREKALSSHAKVHAGDSTIECELCGDIFWSQNQMKEHQRKHHRDQSDSDYDVQQDDDNEDTEEEEETRHRVGRGGVKSEPQQFFCDQCGMGFHRNDLLKKHYKLHVKQESDAHYPGMSTGGKKRPPPTVDDEDDDEEDETEDAEDDSSQHCCHTCGERFAEALELLAHAEIHARFQPFKCNLCGVNFVNEDQIKMHLQQQHPNELTDNSCRLCGKLCKDSRSLMKHAWDHSREKAHSCSKCGKTFHNKARLKRHMISHRDKAVECEICHEEFADGRTLSNHRHAHTKTNQFLCTECGKTFGSRSSQQIHIRIHTGEKPYGCRFCWKAFADGGTLRKHERIHTGEKPYACAVCPRAFNQRVVLREHIRSHHSTPDSKHGSAVTPFYCVVCCSLHGTASDLIQHLVAHSDANTQAKRKPITGPRKYKRRRKLKPHELEQIQKARDTGKANSNAAMQAYSDDEIKPNMLAKYHDDVDDNSEEEEVYEPPVSSKRTKIASRSAVSEDYARSKQIRKTPPKLMVELNSCILPDERDNLDMDVHDDIDIKPKIDRLEHSISLSATDAFDVILEAARNQVSTRNDSKVDPTPIGLYTLKSTNKQSAAKKPIGAQKKLAGEVVNSSGRPKMIHTQKTRMPVADGKRKTKTYITKEIKQETFNTNMARNRARTKSIKYMVDDKEPAMFPIIDDTSFGNGGTDEGDTADEVLPVVEKNVGTRRSTRHTAVSTAVSQEAPPADPVDDDEILLLEISKKNHYMDKYNSDIVNDLEEILRSPIKTTTSKAQAPLAESKLAAGFSSRQSSRTSNRPATVVVNPTPEGSRSSRSQPHVIVVTKQLLPESCQNLTEIAELPMKIMDIKQEQETDDAPEKDLMANIAKAVATNPYKCEMCSASFADRGQLLVHVPIHI